MDQSGLGVEVLEAVPGERNRIGDLALRQDAELMHQLLVGVAAVQPSDDAVDVPGRAGAVDQHDRTLLDASLGRPRLLVGDGMVGHALLDRHRAALQGNVPELADVAEHQHVRIQIKGLAGIACELGDGEAGEGEVGA